MNTIMYINAWLRANLTPITWMNVREMEERLARENKWAVISFNYGNDAHTMDEQRHIDDYSDEYSVDDPWGDLEYRFFFHAIPVTWGSYKRAIASNWWYTNDPDPYHLVNQQQYEPF